MVETTHLNSNLRDRQFRSIAQGALTNSKHSNVFINNVYPTHLERGLGPYVYDHKGNEYIDFINGLGTNLLGYADRRIENVIRESLSNGINLSLPTKYEVEAAESVLTILPSYDRVKFLKTGSGACSAAIKIARNATARKKILTDGYHGWHDPFVSIYEDASGVDNCSVEILQSLNDIDSYTAGVIVEPVKLNFHNREYLNKLVERCNQVGAVLIFDETITALRVPSLSITRHYNLNPDLVIMGKALAGGLPLSCIVGSKYLMDNKKYFVSGTFFGEMVSLSVCNYIITRLKQRKPDIEDLWEFGHEFKEFFNNVMKDIVKLEGYNTRFSLTGSKQLKALFMQEACKARLLFGPSPFISFPMINIKNAIKDKLIDISNTICSGKCKLVGSLPAQIMSGKIRQKGMFK